MYALIVYIFIMHRLIVDPPVLIYYSECLQRQNMG